MAFNTSTRQTGIWIRPIARAGIILFVIIMLTQRLWQPYVDDWRCSLLSAKLCEYYGLIVRYGDPSEFYMPPFPPAVDAPDKGCVIEPADKHSALTALIGVRKALSKYPPTLLQRYLSAVFISGILKIYGVQAGGSYAHSWIVVSATPDYEQFGSEVYEATLNHELSSLFLKNSDFPMKRWEMINEADFSYLPRQIDVVRSAALANRRDPTESPSWHMAGFVSDYGMASLENDFNTYAELAMTHPGRLRELAAQYPRIRAKTRILVEFYSSLAPELRDYFERTGLINSGVDYL
jgi:hypothetical protein